MKSLLRGVYRWFESSPWDQILESTRRSRAPFSVRSRCVTATGDGNRSAIFAPRLNLAEATAGAASKPVGIATIAIASRA